jgi:hypothetical protein
MSSDTKIICEVQQRLTDLEAFPRPSSTFAAQFGIPPKPIYFSLQSSLLPFSTHLPYSDTHFADWKWVVGFAKTLN